MAMATSLEEAIMIEEAGIELVITSGSEAGGYRAFFLKPAEESLTSTRLLVHQMVNRTSVSVPVIPVGCISNGKDIADVLKLGASAVQMGTVFLATDESGGSDIHKSKLLSTQPIKTNLTKVYTGRLARVISDSLSEIFKDSTSKYSARYTIQSNFLSFFRSACPKQEKLEYLTFWPGQPSTILKHRSTKKLFDSLIKAASKG
ncbi:hypothetical protein CXF67_02905 [Psychroflexus sp. MES1-P1E]|nr:hypothetical protein CXF67_02905 [Psychroflexus sp. MES1-P1E]